MKENDFLFLFLFYVFQLIVSLFPSFSLSLSFTVISHFNTDFQFFILFSSPPPLKFFVYPPSFFFVLARCGLVSYCYLGEAFEGESSIFPFLLLFHPFSLFCVVRAMVWDEFVLDWFVWAILASFLMDLLGLKGIVE